MKISYTPQPFDTREITLLPEVQQLIEQIAANVHEVWAATRISEGWKYGPIRKDEQKEHPCLVPYDHLPENEKEYDRKTATETLKAIVLLGFEISKR